MQQQNVVNANGFTIKVSKKQLPFSNNFVQYKAIAEQHEPNEVQAYVQCTANSNEPGRIYFVAYSKTDGKLIECYTVN
jgi:hypothetical protein